MITAKLQLLQDTFESKFDINKFRTFTREFFNEPEMLSGKRHIGIWKEYENSIISYSDIGKFKDVNGNTILVFAVELKSEKGVERARSLQRNFVSKILDDNNCEAAIVAFYSDKDVNWRLSFVRLDYTFKNKGLELDLTPAKRYSYLVGENETSHTAQKQLYPIFEDDKHNPTIDEIENAFSVEKVTKDFFEQYKNKYYDLKEYLEKDVAFINETKKLGFEVDKFSEQFAKKLMGQLAFLYFLQKKGWLGVRIMPEDHSIEKSSFNKIYNDADNTHKEILKKIFIIGKNDTIKLSGRFISISDSESDLLSDCFVGTKFDMSWGSGNKRFIRGIFDSCINNSNKNFFDDYLEPFFYDALNKRRKNQYYKKFNCKIPFLNGGLFEPLEGYHWLEAKFEIPNIIFSNSKEKGREADGILDIFDRYNFTMNEDEPLEKEVAVDPEMLGKIFENLLDGKDRKAKGAFYTPREIVHYMCQESLANYLVNEVDVPYDDMKEFILYGELIRDADNRTNVGYGKDFTIKQSIFDKIVQIDEALKNIRVADPAVGSGAFPLGMLNEIVRARNNITEYLIRLDKTGKLDRKYGEVYIRRHRSQYKMKWDTIKDSIFAVDIEPSAVDIAKLRLWLSVVVEQEIDEDNPEPHPLPNLDCNIMVGNSLIDEYEGIKLFDEKLLHKYKNNNNNSKEKSGNEIANSMQLSMLIDDSDNLLRDMFELQDRLFNEDDEHKKKDIKGRIDKIRDYLIEYKLNREGNSKGINKYREIKKLKMKPFFIWELEFAKVFKEKGGFDVVVGNPPYVGHKGGLKDFFKLMKKTEFGKKYNNERMDIFYYFYHKAIDILKEEGLASFITTNYFFTADSAIKLRKDLCKRTMLINIVNFNEYKIFKSALGQHNTILLLKKGNDNCDCKVTLCNHKGFISNQVLNTILLDSDNETIYFKTSQKQLYNEVNYNILLNPNNTIRDNILIRIFEKMRNNPRLGDYFNISQGIVSGLDKIGDKHLKKLLEGDIKKDEGCYVLTQQERDTEFCVENKYIKNWFKNSDIYKYVSNEVSSKYVLYLNTDYSFGDCKEVDTHILRYKSYIQMRNYDSGELSKANKMNKWWAMSSSRKEFNFETPKIVSPQRSKTNKFAYNEVQWYASADVYFITDKMNDKRKLKFLLAILNSKLLYLWLYYMGKRKGEDLELYLTPLSQIPIVSAEGLLFDTILNTVNQILDLKKTDIKSDTHLLEVEIDKMVYKLYGLSDEEVKVIEDINSNNLGGV